MFCKKLDLKISAEIDQIEKFVFQFENIFKALRYVFSQLLILSAFSPKTQHFLALVSHGIKMLKIFFTNQIFKQMSFVTATWWWWSPPPTVTRV